MTVYCSATTSDLVTSDLMFVDSITLSLATIDCQLTTKAIEHTGTVQPLGCITFLNEFVLTGIADNSHPKSVICTSSSFLLQIYFKFCFILSVDQAISSNFKLACFMLL